MSARARVRNLVVALVLASVASAAVVVAAQSKNAGGGVVVHEWGTFTSVAGADGQSVPWRPLSGPSDLPCFVHVLKDGPKTWVPGGLPAVSTRVRMETPVIYFYSPDEAERTVSVRVSFNQGLITEWFPAAAQGPEFIPKEIATNVSTLTWNDVKITPGATPTYPREKAPSHYYPARTTDASPLSVSGQAEKFLFYRGLADFNVPITVTATESGGVVWSPVSKSASPQQLILFTNRGGRIGYSRVDGPVWKTSIPAPQPASFETLRADLERMLIDDGLFEREAKAMVETWRDSWFEEGTRLLYIVPRATVDALLPLEVSPTPKHVARVFVGRIEVPTPAVLADIEQGLRTGNLQTLQPYSRFVEPFAAQVMKTARDLDPARVQNTLRLIAASYVPEAPCR